MSELLPGLQSHLDSALSSVRTLGMVVGESVTAAIDPDGQKLSFQVEDVSVSVVYSSLFAQSTLILTSPPSTVVTLSGVEVVQDESR